MPTCTCTCHGQAVDEARLVLDRSRLAAFIAAGTEGVTREAIRSGLYTRNKSAREIDALLAPLILAGLVELERVPTSGRPKTVYHLAQLKGI